MGDLVGFDEEERHGVKLCFGDLQELCRVRWQKVPQSVVETVGLAMELDNDAVLMLPGAADEADPRIEELAGQLASARAKDISLTSKLNDLKEVRDKAMQEHEGLLRRYRQRRRRRRSILVPSGTAHFLTVMACCGEFGELLMRLMNVVSVMPIR